MEHRVGPRAHPPSPAPAEGPRPGAVSGPPQHGHRLRGGRACGLPRREGLLEDPQPHPAAQACE